METNLFQRGQEALDRGEYANALQDFLRLRDARLDLVQTWKLGGAITCLRLRDLDRDAQNEVAAASAAGEFVVHSLTGPAREARLPESCRTFRIYQRNQHISLVALSSRGGHDVLAVYDTRSDPTRRFSKCGELNPPITDAAVLDIAIKHKQIYVATSDGKIYQYNGVSLQRQGAPLDVGKVVCRLNTGGPPATEDEALLKDRLLGLCEDGGLLQLDIQLGTLTVARALGGDTRYVDAFLADPGKDGTQAIIACASDGKIHIYDWYTGKLRYAYSCPDEFYCLYCDDIDGDSNLEIAVGARSNRIYILHVVDGELQVKWTWQTGHRVTALWMGNVNVSPGKANDKRLVAGLADGSLQVAKCHSLPEMKRSVEDAYQKLAADTETRQLHELLCQQKRPEVVRFALDKIARDMADCDEVVEFLSCIERQDAYDCTVEILPRLKLLLRNCGQARSLVDYVVAFVSRLFKRYPDLPTCERICSALDGIVRDVAAGTPELVTCAEQFQSELRRRQTLRPQRARYILELAGAGKLAEASQEVETLKLLGVDLLRSLPTTTAVTGIWADNAGSRLIYAAEQRGVFVVGAQADGPGTPLSGPAAVVAGAVSDARYSLVLGHGTTLDIYSSDLTPLRSVSYSRSIRCLHAFIHRGDLYWAAALEDRRVFIEGASGARSEIQLPVLPVQVTGLRSEDRVDVFAVSVDGRLYRLGSPGQDRGRLADPEFTLPDSPNVLDIVPLPGARGDQGLLILSLTSLYVLRPAGKGWNSQQITPGGALTCVTTLLSPNGTVEALVGSRERSLLRVSLQGEVRGKIDLPGMPLAIRVLQPDQSGPTLAVGFSQGGLAWYHLVSEADADHLVQKSARYREFGGAWDKYDLRQKLALLALAQSDDPLDSAGVHVQLKSPIGLLISEEALNQVLKELEDRGVVEGQVAGSGVRYAVKDANYAAWLRTQDQLGTVHLRSAEMFRSVRLVDVARIDRGLTECGEMGWPSTFLSTEPAKWRDLVSLSELLTRRSNASAEDQESLRKAFMDIVLKSVGAVPHGAVPVEPALAPFLSAYEIAFPAIRFQGFDKMLVVVLSTRESADINASLNWLKLRRGWKLVLVLTPRNKDTIRSALRYHSSFKTLVVDYEDLKNVVAAKSPPDAFLDLFIEKIDLAGLSPFEVGGPVSRTFYGRESELQKVSNSLGRMGKGSAIVGPRQIGKTSLLYQVKQYVETMPEYRTLWLDGMAYGEDVLKCFTAILRNLDIQAECTAAGEFVTLIDDYCRRQKQTVVLIMDEVDSLVDADGPNHTFSGPIHALVNAGRIKPVFAGFRSFWRSLRDYNAPFFHLFSQIITLGELDREAATRLIKEPLQSVLQIEGQATNDLLEGTARYPNFIQFCCDQLVKLAGREHRRELRPDDVKGVVLSQELYDHMLGVHLQNLDKRGSLVLNLLVAYYDPQLGLIVPDRAAYEKGVKSQYAREWQKHAISKSFIASQVHGLCEAHKVPLNLEELKQVLDDLVMASILRREEGQSRYAFSFPDLPAVLMRHDEVELSAVDLMERIDEVFPGRVK